MTKASVALLAALCAAAALSACSSDSTPAGACTTAPPSGEPLYVVHVDFGSATLSTGTDNNVFATVYPNYGAALQTSGCPGTQSGSCCFAPSIQQCVLPMQVNAGPMTASDGATQLGQLTFSGTTYGDLDSSSQAAVRWSPGDVLSVSGGGSSSIIPAFSASLTAPAALAGVTPALTSTVTIPRSSDFVIHWTPGTGTATVQLFVGDVPLNSIACTAPVTAGTLTVPSALLEKLGAGTGSISIGSYASGSTTTSNAVIKLSSETDPKVGGATLQ